MNIPAFPRPLSSLGDETSGDQIGMTLRDYFATHIMAAIVNGTAMSDPQSPLPWRENKQSHPQWCAEYAYIYADAMLKERSKL